MTEGLSELVAKCGIAEKKPSIFLAVPSCRDWKVDFGTSLTNLAVHLTSKFCRGDISGLFVNAQVASLLSLGRELLIRQALDSGASHILWIDDDTKFSHEVFDYMISRNVDYVACNMVRKQFPLSATAYGKDGKSVDSCGKTGIEEVFHVGLGMCLMNLDIVRNIPAPLFEVTWQPEKGTYQGEDMYLCDKLRANGVKLYIDHDASALVSHVGDFAYTANAPISKKVAA